MDTSTHAIDTVKHFLNDYSASIEEGSAGKFLGFTPENLYQLELVAHGLYVKKRYNKAITILEGLIELDRHRAYPFLLLGEVLMAQQDYEAAKTALESADALDPHNVNVRLKLGELLLKTGENEQALAALEEIVAMEVPAELHIKRSRAQVLLHQLKTRPLTANEDVAAP